MNAGAEAASPSAVREAFALQASWAMRLSSPFMSALCTTLAGHLDDRTAVGRRILPKAEDEQTARRCLQLIGGRRHVVLSAIALLAPCGTLRERVSQTVVRFKPLSAQEIEAYLAGGEWAGKAGGYAIQGAAEALIAWIGGSHSGVVGLPLFETRALLRGAGFGLA